MGRLVLNHSTNIEGLIPILEKLALNKNIKTITSSGGALSKKMLEGSKKLFPNSNFFSMYGLTEAFRSTFLDPNELSRKPNSIGKAIPDVKILVLDEKVLKL